MTDTQSVWNNLVALIDQNSLQIINRITFQHNKDVITEQFKWESLLNQRPCLPHRMEGYFSMKCRQESAGGKATNITDLASQLDPQKNNAAKLALPFGGFSF